MGFILPDASCDDQAIILIDNNEVGVNNVGVIFTHPQGNFCSYAGRIASYHAEKCIMFGNLKFFFFILNFYFIYFKYLYFFFILLAANT